MSTGVLRGSGLLTLRSGKTTSVAHVLSVVRTNSSVTGEPFATETVLGVYPFSSATILIALVAAAPGAADAGVAGAGSGALSARPHAAAIAPRAVTRIKVFRFACIMLGSPWVEAPRRSS